MSAAVAMRPCQRYTPGYGAARHLCGRCGWRQCAHADPTPGRLDVLSDSFHAYSARAALALTVPGVAYLAVQVARWTLR